MWRTAEPGRQTWKDKRPFATAGAGRCKSSFRARASGSLATQCAPSCPAITTLCPRWRCLLRPVALQCLVSPDELSSGDNHQISLDRTLRPAAKVSPPINQGQESPTLVLKILFQVNVHHYLRLLISRRLSGPGRNRGWVSDVGHPSAHNPGTKLSLTCTPSMVTIDHCVRDSARFSGCHLDEDGVTTPNVKTLTLVMVKG
jgi:hypothetical protein